MSSLITTFTLGGRLTAFTDHGNSSSAEHFVQTTLHRKTTVKVIVIIITTVIIRASGRVIIFQRVRLRWLSLWLLWLLLFSRICIWSNLYIVFIVVVIIISWTKFRICTINSIIIIKKSLELFFR